MESKRRKSRSVTLPVFTHTKEEMLLTPAKKGVVDIYHMSSMVRNSAGLNLMVSLYHEYHYSRFTVKETGSER